MRHKLNKLSINGMMCGIHKRILHLNILACCNIMSVSVPIISDHYIILGSTDDEIHTQ